MKIEYTGRFKKDFKRQEKRGKDISKLRSVISALVNQGPLQRKHKDHPLSGEWAKRRECHIEGDWLLIYKIEKGTLTLERTGTHSDLFE